MLLSVQEINKIVDNDFVDIEIKCNNNIGDVIGSKYDDIIRGIKYTFIVMDIIIKNDKKIARVAFLSRDKFMEEYYGLDEIRCLLGIITDRDKEEELNIKLYEHRAAERIMKAWKKYDIQLYHKEAIELSRLFKQEFCSYKEYCLLLEKCSIDKIIRITYEHIIDTIIKIIDEKRGNL